MKRFSYSQFLKYRWHSRWIDGWIHPFAARFMFDVSYDQARLGIGGSIAEIGVHHGKSFIPMYLGIDRDEHAIAIDVFEHQEYNVDSSGRGDRNKFLTNLSRVAGEREGVELIIKPSDAVSSGDLLKFGRVRIFSIDGSHTEKATFGDMSLAGSVLSDGGLIVLDDLFNERWPGVMGGASKFLSHSNDIVPAFVLPGRVVLCTASFVERYHEWCRLRFFRWIDFEKELFGYLVIGLGVNGSYARRQLRNTALGEKISRLRRSILSAKRSEAGRD